MDKKNGITAESVMIILDARAFVYKLFQSLFGNEPTVELLEILKDSSTKMALETFADEANYGKLLKELAKYMKTYDIEKISSEYTKLFIGPGKLPAPPWESVYISGEPVLMNEGTLAVRGIYKSYGFLPENYPHVADDHLALELDFMALLGEKIIDDANAAEEIEETLAVSAGFLEEHLLKWLPEFTAQIQGHGVFYPLLVSLLNEFVKTDSSVLYEIMRGM